MTDNQTTELTQKDIFNPTPHMLTWLDIAIQVMSDSPLEIEQACEQAGTPITRQAWYKWIKDEQFRLWYKVEWDKRLAMVGPTLDAIGLKQAKRDHKYWQDMQKRVGNFKDESQGKGVYIQQNFTEHAKKELEEFK